MHVFCRGGYVRADRETRPDPGMPVRGAPGPPARFGRMEKVARALRARAMCVACGFRGMSLRLVSWNSCLNGTCYRKEIDVCGLRCEA